MFDTNHRKCTVLYIYPTVEEVPLHNTFHRLSFVRCFLDQNHAEMCAMFPDHFRGLPMIYRRNSNNFNKYITKKNVMDNFCIHTHWWIHCWYYYYYFVRVVPHCSQMLIDSNFGHRLLDLRHHQYSHWNAFKSKMKNYVNNFLILYIFQCPAGFMNSVLVWRRAIFIQENSYRFYQKLAVFIPRTVWIRMTSIRLRTVLHLLYRICLFQVCLIFH